MIAWATCLLLVSHQTAVSPDAVAADPPSARTAVSAQVEVAPEDDPELINRGRAGDLSVFDQTDVAPPRLSQNTPATKTAPPGGQPAPKKAIPKVKPSPKGPVSAAPAKIDLTKPAKEDLTKPPKEDLTKPPKKAGELEYNSPFDGKDASAEAPAVETKAPAVPKEPVEPFVTPKDAKGVLGYADHLFLDGDWYRSISEYRRFLYMVKGRGDSAPRAALAIGEALLRGEQWDAAARQLDGVAARTSDLTLRRTALFASGRAYLLDGRPEFAKPRFRLLSEDKDADATLREEATWLLAWGHFDAGELEKARVLFETISKTDGTHADDAAGALGLLAEEEGLPTKNILLAGALSLIPGLGHFYLGQWTVGLTSLSWNALFIVAAVLAWVQGQWGPAIVLTIVELGFYSGGIFGSISGAYRHNRDVVRNWRDQILSDYGATRELPVEGTFGDRVPKPGTLMRFGGSF